MEKFRCKLCLRNFANGKALGGHKRSHMMNFYAVKKQKKVQTFEKDSQPSDDFQLSSSTSEEEDEDDDDGEKEVSCYGLRENPKKSIRFVDRRFFFSSSSTVVLQERESETESILNPIFRRSKRTRKTRISAKETEMVKKSESQKGENSNEFSDQPLSSVSDTPEEDVAHCLMMLSRDTWHREQHDYEEEDRERNKYEDVDDDYSEDFGAVKVAKVRGKYRCETCNKVFRSYQALGGHRANHKKIKVNITAETPPRAAAAVVETGRNGGSVYVEEKIHECPICYRVFSSGQALGGHKRSHFIGGGAIPVNVNSVSTHPLVAEPFSRIGETLNIDLNLPAPVDDDVNFS